MNNKKEKEFELLLKGQMNNKTIPCMTEYVQKVQTSLNSVVCKKCGKKFQTNRDTNYCWKCEKKQKE